VILRIRVSTRLIAAEAVVADDTLFPYGIVISVVVWTAQRLTFGQIINDAADPDSAFSLPPQPHQLDELSNLGEEH
jgi:hypothetical protein